LPLESGFAVSEELRRVRPLLKTDPSNIRLLQFAPRAPWPLDTGAKLRNYHLARVLSALSRVALLAFGEQEPKTSEIESVYERIVTVPQDRRYSFGKLLRGAVGRTPLPLLNYTTEGMKQALARMLDENDLISFKSRAFI